MKRAKPYKILLVMAIMVAGGICMLLPEKNAMPVASVNNIVKNSHSSTDTILVASSDSSVLK